MTIPPTVVLKVKTTRPPPHFGSPTTTAINETKLLICLLLPSLFVPGCVRLDYFQTSLFAALYGRLMDLNSFHIHDFVAIALFFITTVIGLIPTRSLDFVFLEHDE